ncbi:hypothetical protein K504DRAFT_137345 [Pleomassaria siparia CBS 279.74]|uniref:Uncharacterized protein n=1 Tax=Pleomassaria siparia CBS 279.74 TaxID=1314801 RepID=A0A6G1KM31_9PLEO|nr:hypothetical protein K504DRAFT_137345 [Pleomassaria siparia CBS 279.74]
MFQCSAKHSTHPLSAFVCTYIHTGTMPSLSKGLHITNRHGCLWPFKHFMIGILFAALECRHAIRVLGRATFTQVGRELYVGSGRTYKQLFTVHMSTCPRKY